MNPKAYAVRPHFPGRVACGCAHGRPSQSQLIFIHDLGRAASMRLTFSKTPDVRPLWTPDGRWVFFRGESEGLGIYRKRSDGSGSIGG